MRCTCRCGVTMTRMAKETMAQLLVPLVTRAARMLRVGLMALPAAVLAGCFNDLRQSTVHPESDSGRVIQDVYRMVTWIDTGIFILVVILLAWAVWRYR